MRKSIATTILALSFLLLISNDAYSQRPRPAPTPKATGARRQPTMDQEGRNLAKQYWDKYLIKCGSSYFYQPNGYVVEELRDTPHFSFSDGALQPKHLSRADQLNGVDPLPVEYEASSGFEFQAVKEHRDEGSYGWQTGTNTRWGITIRRIKGRWEVPVARNITCPQMLKLR
jgi:hypothetical protein